MKNAKMRVFGGGVATATVLALAACSGSGSGSGDAQTAGASASATSDGGGTAANPVTVDFWGWNQGQQAQVDAFNAAHDTIKLKYTQQPGNPDLATALTNAVTAGSGIPCLVQAPSSPVAMLSKGLIQPITDQFAGNESKFAPVAVDSQKAGGEVLGIPFGAQPAFAIANKKVYDDNGVKVPTTWEDMIAVGKQLAPKGIAVLNLAGEDPSTLVTMANQAGATWFAIDGDAWKVDIDSPETHQAGDILQQLIDEDAVTNETYADMGAMAQTYDQGKMVTIPLSTWQLAAWQTRLTTSIGQWASTTYPQYANATKFTTPGAFVGYSVPKGCTDVQAAVTAGVWLATADDSLKIASDPAKGASVYPAIPDASAYVDTLLPATLLSNRDATPPIIAQAVDATRVQWIDSPSAGYFEELVSQWAKAVTKQITMDDLIKHMQAWVVADLKKSGIKVEEG